MYLFNATLNFSFLSTGLKTWEAGNCAVKLIPISCVDAEYSGISLKKNFFVIHTEGAVLCSLQLSCCWEHYCFTRDFNVLMMFTVLYFMFSIQSYLF
jgi:hypothetical protein